MNQAQKHRDACDACHYRKIRCILTSPGACSNCQNSGRVCAFSPRDEMGRPKKSAPKKSRENARKKSASKNPSPPIPPKKQDDPDHPLPSTEDKTMPDAFPKEESTMPADTIPVGFSEDWQNFLAFPSDDKDNFFSTPAMLPTPITNPTTDDNPFHFPTPGPAKLPTLPSPVLFERHNAPINFEDFSNNGPDLFAGSNHPPPPTRNNSIQSNMSITNDSTLETHRMLSNVLYDLRLEYGKQWSTLDCEAPRRDGIFRSVSLLCDIAQDVLSGREGLVGRTPANIDSETNITFMLTLTGISMILNIYKSLCQMYSGQSDINELVSSNSDFDNMFEPSILPASNASMSLDKIVHLTTMDFHLARLQRMFSTPNAPSSFQMALLGTGEGGEQIHELRTTVQRLIERLKTA
ncbi:hypothetical protein ACLMJK_001957 [Lecanora helva]